jgi:hypothetical protein
MMENSETSRQKIFVNAKLNKPGPVALLDSEWLTLQTRTGRQISADTRRHLLRVTNIYASSWRDPGKSVTSLKQIQKDIEDWRKRTAGLRNKIWKKDRTDIIRESIERSKLMKRIDNGQIDIDQILNRKFNKNVAAYPLAILDHMLKNAVAASEFITAKITMDGSATTRGTELWFLWAALVIAHLNAADRRMRNPKKFPHKAESVLEKLQSKLPAQRRKGESLKRGAVQAFKMSKRNSIDGMEFILKHWSKGDVSMMSRRGLKSFSMVIFLAHFKAAIRATNINNSRGISAG